MTGKVFWDDPYLTELDARVAGVNGDEVRLDRTIFFAESGGQESDRGTVAGMPVLAARIEGRDIVHILPAGHGLKAGDPARVAIDWARRYRLMRLHFAAELVLEIAGRALPGARKVGAHIAEDKARIDFAWGQSVAPHLPALKAEADAVCAADRAIISAFEDRAAERRYWQIEGFARVPCGGTHLKRTGEIGAVALKRVNIGKGKERIEIRLDP